MKVTADLRRNAEAIGLPLHLMNNLLGYYDLSSKWSKNSTLIIKCKFDCNVLSIKVSLL